MTLRLLFGLGIGFAIAGLAFSIGLHPWSALTGSILTLSSLVCGLAVIMIDYMSADRDRVIRNKPVMRALVIITIALSTASLVSTFKDYPWHHYAQPLWTFWLCLVILLLPRLQGKIY